MRRRNARRILVVEDDPSVLAMSTRILQAAGFEVTQAVDGVAALEALAGRHSLPCLVVTDIRMPHMGGLELGERVAETLPEVPVLYTSGWADESVKALESQDLAFLAKPYTAKQLLDQVEAICGPASGSPPGERRR